MKKLVATTPNSYIQRTPASALRWLAVPSVASALSGAADVDRWTS